jgi:hypothetical protein
MDGDYFGFVAEPVDAFDSRLVTAELMPGERNDLADISVAPTSEVKVRQVL